ncbi:hypothetical protein O4H66_06260 [Comamonadaceae bacterium G21597-S1]|nr:hypothetical protein [Comamonadaceae bacterium G21597-S1]
MSFHHAGHQCATSPVDELLRSAGFISQLAGNFVDTGNVPTVDQHIGCAGHRMVAVPQKGVFNQGQHGGCALGW